MPWARINSASGIYKLQNDNGVNGKRGTVRINKTNSAPDKFTDFLGHYWKVTHGHTTTVCGDSWDNDKKCLNAAYLFMYGAVNWFGQQNNLTIDDTLGVFALFFIKHVGLSASETSSLLDELIHAIEKEKESLFAMKSGQRAVVEFLADKPDALNHLPALIVNHFIAADADVEIQLTQSIS